MKILILLVAVTFVAANPSINPRIGCREPNDYNICEKRCKSRGYDGYQCDELTGCNCYQIADKTEEIPDETGSKYPDYNFKCFSSPDREFCESYCLKKGFVRYTCDLETICSCYGDSELVPYSEGEIIEDFNLIEKINEDIQPIEKNREDKPELQCNSQLDGDSRCYSYCKTIGMRNGKCQSDGQCNCYNMDILPTSDVVMPERRCIAGLENDRTCNKFCEVYGFNYGKCEQEGKCGCYGDDIKPYKVKNIIEDFDLIDRVIKPEKIRQKCLTERDYLYCREECLQQGFKYGECRQGTKDDDDCVCFN
jgi:hypothetical protein